MIATPSTLTPPTRPKPHRPRSYLMAWFLWGLSCTFLLGMLPLLITVTSTATQSPAVFPFHYAQQLHLSFSDWVGIALAPVVTLTFSTLGALIVTRHPENRIGWIFCFIGVLLICEPFTTYYALYTLWVQPGALPGGLAAAWFQNWIWVVSYGLLVVFLPLIFPNGRLLSRRWRPVGWLGACEMAVIAFGGAFHPGPLWNNLEPLQIPNPLGIEALSRLFTVMGDLPFELLLLTMLVSASSLLLRWRRARGEELLQIKWFAFFAVVLVLLFIIQGLVRHLLHVSTPTFELLWRVSWTVAAAGLPLVTGLAILKYRLYEIDLIINRTLVYGTLTTFVIGMYILIVGSLSVMVQANGNLLSSLLATGLIAVLFQPLRDRLQRGVNHLMYGERDEPHAVLVRLGKRLEATLSPDAVLSVIVETVAQALKLPYVAVSLKRDEQFPIAASHGHPRENETLLRLPLITQSEHLGELLLAPREPNTALTPADHVLLQDLTRHIGVALHAVRLTIDLQQLTSELQRSRSHLITLREEERRRLRRDLHDGLGAALTSMTFKLDAASNLLDRDPLAVRTLLRELKEQSQDSIADIRRLVYNLRPPILDEWGLVASLREQVAQYQLQAFQAHVCAPESLPPLPAAVEVAAYRIALEGLANVIRHAHATWCTICLEVREDALIVEIRDNGKGLPPDFHAGVGISAMRERAAELGGSCTLENPAAGGTQVSARLPFFKEEILYADRASAYPAC
jgi:two-component system NarL family sensor kinase